MGTTERDVKHNEQPLHATDPLSTAELRAKLAEAEDTLRAIRSGEVDALVVDDVAQGNRIYTLRTADHPYRALVEQMQEGAATLTPTGDVLYCNRRFTEIVGVPTQQLLGQPLERFMSVAARDRFREFLGSGSGRQRARIAMADGRSLEAYFSLQTATDADVERRYLLVADLSELADAESGRDRAERESRAKDEFMAMLAHELRNPLGAIAAAVQVLDTRGQGDGPEGKAVGVITRQIGHLAHLIDDLLDASRAVTGKIHLSTHPVNLAEFVSRGVVIGAGGAHHERQIDVHLDPVWVNADEVRVEQIVGNLVGNAVKYTQPGGRIRVVLKAEPAHAVLVVEDDGAGIDRNLLPRIFDLFVQGDTTLDRTPGGLGIGLTLVRELVEHHGGSVVAESAGLGQGSRFIVRLPRIAAPAEGAAPPAAAERVLGRLVLVVDDNRDFREMYRMVLELDGHEVIEAEDGLRALELLNSTHPALALVDIGLPGLNGYEVARQFRSKPESRRTMLVALTGYGSAEDCQRSKEAGFDHHLLKPIAPDTIRALLKDIGQDRRL
jgi:PAS domain S-box-containing protein